MLSGKDLAAEVAGRLHVSQPPSRRSSRMI